MQSIGYKYFDLDLLFRSLSNSYQHLKIIARVLFVLEGATYLEVKMNVYGHYYIVELKAIFKENEVDNILKF